jgi:hypothetical protein
MAKKIKYTEPTGYFPQSIRKEFGLGEYAKEAPKKKDEKKTPVKKADTKKK